MKYLFNTIVLIVASSSTSILAQTTAKPDSTTADCKIVGEGCVCNVKEGDDCNKDSLKYCEELKCGKGYEVTCTVSELFGKRQLMCSCTEVKKKNQSKVSDHIEF